MDAADDITAWIDGIRVGDSFAAERLWSAYFDKLTRVAAQQLAGARKAPRDEEDVALSAFKSFCFAAREGRFEKLVDRESLWPLLVSITAHKSVDAIRHANRKKRGGAERVEHGLSAFDFLDAGPTPEFAAELSEQLQVLLARLDETGDPQLKSIAIAKMSGEGTAELAKRLDCARRTVERKMQIIRRILAEQMDDDPFVEDDR